MGLKDVLEKQIEGFEDVFADIVNVLLLSDKSRKVNPEDLRDARARSIYTSSGEIREQERDNVKLWVSGNMVICLFGIENQTTVDRDMPVRVFGYEAGDYRLQAVKRRDEANAARKAQDFGGSQRCGGGAWKRGRHISQRALTDRSKPGQPGLAVRPPLMRPKQNLRRNTK